MNIKNFIPKGFRNRISRKDLEFVTGQKDRINRHMIEEAQRAGSVIVSFDKGYFQRQDERDDEYIRAYLAKEWRRNYDHRLKLEAIYKAWKGIDNNQIPGQMKLDLGGYDAER